MTTLERYEATLTQVGEQGTVSVAFAREILAAAREEIEQRAGEFSVTQAVEISGRSRSWFERRLPEWQETGLARKVGALWLLKAAAIPARTEGVHGFDPRLGAEAIGRRLDEMLGL